MLHRFICSHVCHRIQGEEKVSINQAFIRIHLSYSPGLATCTQSTLFLTLNSNRMKNNGRIKGVHFNLQDWQ